ncbi:Tfp pilus assembly protein PilF [Silvibacterium bohemicum]|uniref:Tfp pilus assembly protein PilF n=1 Tax=Silvibacterium bohemicum TaxID=1577686 RepID=A0A841JQ40_9BACT|nr:tetratricopeptide repeat protein [Silvibacterium bohemicum]MBB6142545.1 Tfp pilus assembly protein PilF [Silvibacterium bohemicum]
MLKKIACLPILCLCFSTSLRAANPTWVEIRSAHFTVLTDSNEKRGRQLLDQFERMRWVFQTMFPKSNVDPVSPITILAVKDKKDFQALEPEAYLSKNALNLAGYFLTAPDKNYIALRLDAEGEHPFATVYHEYTHLQLSPAGEWLPLWLNEGLAEFFQNTDIHDKNVQLGQPSPDDIYYLRQSRMMPLVTLLKVDVNSPYYHEEQKGSVFYAEAWALTHYLEITDRKNNTHRLHDYTELMSQHLDSVTAAEKAFGDLKQLEKDLNNYVAQGSFSYFTLNSAAAPLDEASYQVTALSPAQADAVRADFLAYAQRTKDARTLLDTVLREDPNNVLAHETMGYLEFRDGNRDAARKWYEEAVKLDSQSFIANYYYASMSFGSRDDATQAQVEASLQTAIKLNPRFAPAYDELASLYGMHQEKLDEAHRLNLQAVALEPANVNYRMNAANILLTSGRAEDAIRVLKAAEGVAKSPQELSVISVRLAQLEQFQAVQESTQTALRDAKDLSTAPGPPPGKVATRLSSVGNFGAAGSTIVESAPPRHPDETPHAPWHTAKGVIRDVQCSDPAIFEITVIGAGKTVQLYSDNYYKVEFSAANFTPEGEIHPCKDLQGMKASVKYSESSDKTIDGQVVAVELSK